ncbi:putative cytochrome C552 [Candidatus Paraburkholderia kirkii]|nr:putative cytochrome C552 [Candidatus Paraburkholderia kirkii]
MRPLFARRTLTHAARALAELAWISACGNCLAFSTPEPSRLIDQQRCMFCHTVDTPFRAPSFQQISVRYRGVPGASDMLENKLRKGGEAHWGKIAMPSDAGRGSGLLSHDDAHTLVQWVLSQ